MVLLIRELLPPEDRTRIVAALAGVAWTDGRATAGATAGAVKANAQADPADPAAATAAAEVSARLRDHPLVAAFALPLRFTRPMFSRTIPGGGYGTHVDNAVMGSGETAVRTDIAWTLFLTGAPDVAGGALVIEETGGERRIEPEAGLMVLYPASSLHRVETVTAGVRLAAVGWIQSRVRAADRRAVLFDLHLAETGAADGPLRVQLARANLLRMWAG